MWLLDVEYLGIATAVTATVNISFDAIPITEYGTNSPDANAICKGRIGRFDSNIPLSASHRTSALCRLAGLAV